MVARSRTPEGARAGRAVLRVRGAVRPRGGGPRATGRAPVEFSLEELRAGLAAALHYPPRWTVLRFCEYAGGSGPRYRLLVDPIEAMRGQLGAAVILETAHWPRLVRVLETLYQFRRRWASPRYRSAERALEAAGENSQVEKLRKIR